MDPKDFIHYLDRRIESTQIEILKLEAKIEAYREIKMVTEKEQARNEK